MKKIIYDSQYTGILGEDAGYDNLCVGDVLNIQSKITDWASHLMVVYDTDRKRFTVLGMAGYSLPELYNIYEVEKVASYKIITEDNIKSLTTFPLSLVNVELPKRTLEQIKEELGYDFELVETIK